MGRPGEGGGWHAAAAGQPPGRRSPARPAGDGASRSALRGRSRLRGTTCGGGAARPRRQANPNAVAMVRFACASAFSQRIPVAPADGRGPPPERGAAEANRLKWQNGEIPRRPLLFFTIPVIPREANRAAMLQIRLGSCHMRIMHLVSYFAA